VLLSDLTHDPAKALHLYLYTGCLPPLCVKNLSTLQVQFVSFSSSLSLSLNCE
jgi:hypothetical protein